MLQITLSEVRFYLQPEKILSPADKATNTLLHKFGGATRKTQQNSMKQAKPGVKSKKRHIGSTGEQRSLPGQPPLRQPKARVDIKNTVFYFADAKTKDVVIGMVLLGGRRGEPMPGVLEHSGQSKVNRFGKIRTVQVKSRPSSVPAYKKTIKKHLPGLIKGGIMREV